jgi:transposase
VDEFALKRGQTYAALLVDLETHQPIEVLPDRSSETFGNWLKAHSGIEIISRDRASSFAKAARLEAPQAQQVADRFHILKNLTDYLDHFFKRKKIWKQPLLAYGKLLAKPAKEVKASIDSAPNPATVTKPRRPGRDEQLKLDRFANRLDRYHQVLALKENGLSNRQVGRELGLGRNTVIRYVRAGSAEVVESKPKTPRPSLLDPYKSYLWRRFLEDQPTIKQLHQELTRQGYTGSIGPIRAFLAKLRPAPWWSATRTKPRRKLEPKDLPQLAYERKISTRSAVWLIFKRDAENETLSEEQRYQRKQLVESDPQIKQVYELVQQFRQIVREKQGDNLKSWLERAKATEIKELVSFSSGIERDEEAVEAGIRLQYSNAQLEGQVNRAKTIKKQMYGRANFKLLRTRILAA